MWLLTAGGATFAAFPEWYATMFSGFYLAFAALLVGLILRGIGIEYRGKAATDAGRAWCDRAFIVGSALPALLLGVAFANIIRGVKMNPSHVMTGNFFDLLSPYALLGGVVTLTLFLFHGAVYLALRTDGAVAVAGERAAKAIAPVTGVAAVAFLLWTTQVRGEWVSFVLAAVIAVLFLWSVYSLFRARFGLAFTGTALVCLLVPIWVFACLWPDVLPALNHPAFSLTVHNASSSLYTLKVMTVVALIFTPIVLAYQAWSYWVFRARVGVAHVAGDGYGGTSVVDKLRAKAAEAAVPPAGSAPRPDRPIDAP